jgi:hypothetical protein
VHTTIGQQRTNVMRGAFARAPADGTPATRASTAIAATIRLAVRDLTVP